MEHTAVISVPDGSWESNDTQWWTQARWLGHLAALGILVTPFSPEANQHDILRLYTDRWEVADTGQTSTVVREVTDEMVLREMSRIAMHLVTHQPKFDSVTRDAIYARPEELYL